MAKAKVTLYEEPRTMYFLGRHLGAYPRVVTNVYGETSRSFLHRDYDYEYGKVYRVNKKDNRILTPDAYEVMRWAVNNRYQIAKAVECCQDPEKVRQIAEIVGYAEVR